ncbi:DUF4407 domain-containing protein [Dactylosporangium matsuzakiense]|uniref:DUF4407 domain-containing protein n=1 Tax=Dactylosporangium matsuzakiense TaxID=53360 RepID=A0A9W6KGM0_9ACTN|nr:DUF4407 domain-containing protein [Dactylosporangium matsuzakiense]GLL01712.1 hypothetical protein GCM10017581_034540 [Dactylosporangium matsuzakiense]
MRNSGTGNRNSPRRPRRRNFMLWLSGADLDTLARAPRERRKFIGVGGIVLTTAVLAAVSSTFALTMGARTPLYAAIPFGLLWGLAIMNLDRWLVTATQRRDKWWQNLLTALPRVLMALVIGAVISTPLVLWLFQPEIDAQLNAIHQRRLDQHQQSLLNDARFKDIPVLQERISKNQAIADGRTSTASDSQAVKDLQAQYDELDKKYQAAQKDATCEFDGTCGSHQFGGGPAYQQKQAVANDLKQQRDAIGTRLDAARKSDTDQQAQTGTNARATAKDAVTRDQQELTRLQQQKKADEDQFSLDTANDTGLLARLEALSELTGKNSTLQTAYLMLLLFITTVEVLPVVVKFLINLAPATAYDEILAKSEKADIFAAEQELVRRQNVAKFEQDARQTREQELLAQRIQRMNSFDDEREAFDDGRPSRRGRRAPKQQPGGYMPWPDDEPPTGLMNGGNTAGGSSRADNDPDEPADDEERLTERWTFDR